MSNAFLIILFLCSNGIGAQSLSIEVEIIPDDFPQDISWEIQNSKSEIIVQESLDGCTPFAPCRYEVNVSDDQCYTFIIRDRIGDGIADGGYKIFVDGQVLVDATLSFSNAQVDINCNIGESCTQAIPLMLPVSPFEKIKAPKNKDYWFKLTPEEYGLYRITTCVNLISGQGYPDTKLWIYESCNRDIIKEGAEGALAFSDDFIQCEPASAFHYFPLEENQDYFIRVRREEDSVDLDSIEVKFVKLPSINGCTDPESCNYNPYANIDNGSCTYEDCLPDLSLDEEVLRNSMILDTIFSNDECLIAEGCLRGPGDREVIRFSTKIDNIGNTDYILGSPDEGISNFSNNNCHGHWHQDGYAEYLLFDGQGTPEPIGFKTGFCVLDLECDGVIPKYICSFMGISAGCSDIYSSDIECQWIDITDVQDGVYTLVVRVNWNRFPDIRGFQEAGFENNWGQVCFSLDRSQGPTKIEILDTCPQYADCQGFAYGQTIIDCEGVCGGASHFGDVDGSGELTGDDVSAYMSLLENGDFVTSQCFDLDANGSIDIYDSVLAYECVEANGDPLTTPYHSHCTFPRGGDDQNKKITFQLSNHNETENTFDVEILSTDESLTGLQIDFDGIRIESVTKLYDDVADYLVHTDKSIYTLHGNNKFQRSTDYKSLYTVQYTMLGQVGCIATSSIAINESYFQVPVELQSNCISLTSSTEAEAFSSIQIYPNPASDYLFIDHENIEIQSIQLYDLHGQDVLKLTDDLHLEQAQVINLMNFSSGVYFLKITTPNQKVHSRKIVISN